MRSDGERIRGNEMVGPHVDLPSVREWVNRTFTKERIADVVVCASTLAILGLVLNILHMALENRTIVGF